MNISGLLYASYLVLLMNRINIENYLIVVGFGSQGINISDRR